MEGIAFGALYKSRVLMIHCKADDFCLFKGPPMIEEIKEKFKQSCGRYQKATFRSFSRIEKNA